MTFAEHVMRSVILDIDGTLLKAGVAGLTAFHAAFERLYGEPVNRPIDTAAKTERRIWEEMVGGEAHGDAFEQFQKVYLEELDARMKASPPVVLPGVRRLLERLHHEGVAVALATGNSKRAADIKLWRAGLASETEDALAAYGDQTVSKTSIVGAALSALKAQCAAAGRRELSSAVVGDSPYDMAAARAWAITGIGVTTGSFVAEALRDAGASEVFSSLDDTARLLVVLRSAVLVAHGVGSPEQAGDLALPRVDAEASGGE